MQTEPKYQNSSASIGDLQISFKGENWGNGLEDTEVKIGDALLCWVTWENKKALVDELNAVIDKYRI